MGEWVGANGHRKCGIGGGGGRMRGGEWAWRIRDTGGRGLGLEYCGLGMGDVGGGEQGMREDRVLEGDEGGWGGGGVG